MEIISGKRLYFRYTNYKGETEVRCVIPYRVVYLQSTGHHSSPQWFIEAHDCERNAPRTFTLKDIDVLLPATQMEYLQQQDKKRGLVNAEDRTESVTSENPRSPA